MGAQAESGIIVKITYEPTSSRRGKESIAGKEIARAFLSRVLIISRLCELPRFWRRDVFGEERGEERGAHSGTRAGEKQPTYVRAHRRQIERSRGAAVVK